MNRNFVSLPFAIALAFCWVAIPVAISAGPIRDTKTDDGISAIFEPQQDSESNDEAESTSKSESQEDQDEKDSKPVDPALKRSLEILERHEIPPTREGIETFLLTSDPDHPSHQESATIVVGLLELLESDDYHQRNKATRDLKKIAVVKMDTLRAAMESGDPEVKYRVQHVIAARSNFQRRDTLEGKAEAACIVAKSNNITGLTDSLFKALNWIDEKKAVSAIQDAIVATVESTDVELVRSFMNDDKENRRIAAIRCLPNLLNENAKPELLDQLRKEKSEKVRLELAKQVGDLGARESLQVFAGLLESEDVSIRVVSNQYLQALTSQDFQFVAYGDLEKRGEAIKRWNDWIQSEGLSAEITFPVDSQKAYFGRILYTDYNQNKVFEVDMEGNEIWSHDVVQAWSVQGLSTGNCIVTSYTGNLLVEIDAEGNEVKKIERSMNSPLGMFRLENGNTLISHGRTVEEFDSNNETVWEVTLEGRTAGLQRLENGNTLVALFDQAKVVEVDSDGETVWELDGLKNPVDVQLTQKGTILVADSTTKAVEYDLEGNVVWEFEHGENVNTANRRLPNGNTLVATTTKIMMVTPEKEVLWEIDDLKHVYGLSFF